GHRPGYLGKCTEFSFCLCQSAPHFHLELGTAPPRTPTIIARDKRRLPAIWYPRRIPRIAPPSAIMQQARGSEEAIMPAVQIDPTLSMYYEDDYFGEAWRQPEAVLLVHGVAESSRAW